MRFWTGWRRFSSTEPSTLQTQMWARQRGWKTPPIKVFEWLIWGAKKFSKDRCRVVTFEWLIIGVSEKPSSGCLEAGNCYLLSVSGLSCRTSSFQNLVLLLYSWTLCAFRWIGPPPCVSPLVVKNYWFRITIIQFSLLNTHFSSYSGERPAEAECAVCEHERHQPGEYSLNIIQPGEYSLNTIQPCEFSPGEYSLNTIQPGKY